MVWSLVLPWFLLTTLVFAAYDTWHVVDVESVVCPTAAMLDGSSASNLAAGKAVTCASSVRTCGPSVTDGTKTCSAAMISATGRSFECSSAGWVEIDLGSAQTINEVVLYQYTCGEEIYCGHRVELSLNGSVYTTVYDAGPDYGYPASSVGASMRFSDQSARYVRVYSSKSNVGTNIPFVEVEVYKRTAVMPEYSIGIDFTTGMDVEAPHIVTFLRSGLGPLSINFDVTDNSGEVVVKRQTVHLMDLEQASIPKACGCTGASPPVLMTSKYGSDYGTSCGTWDQTNCLAWWGEASLGFWCCKSWCYATKDCPDAYHSEVNPGVYFSYLACDSFNQDLQASDCPWATEAEAIDVCACKNVGDIMNGAMLAKFAADYGSKCFVWDSTDCAINYLPEQLDTWCCSQWCYVDETCPHAIPSLNPGMEGKLFWADLTCTQDAQFVSQCHYQNTASPTEQNVAACQCLNISMPDDQLLDGAPADYGRSCAAHDVEICNLTYPEAIHDMWCCLSWCWVSSTCPDAKASTAWAGHFYSYMPCEVDRAAVVSCPFSEVCRCTGSNEGINATIFGVDYGKTCGAWDSTDCSGLWGNSHLWSSTQRNDWCCDSWCYVNESCPIAEASTAGTSNVYSYTACVDDGKLYKNSTNTCEDPIACVCLDITMDATALPAGASSDYGQQCGAHDFNICDQFSDPDMWCCFSWCWVDELCPSAEVSRAWPGHYYSWEICEKNVTAIANCPWSTACECVGNNTGVDSAVFGSDYGTSCAAWDNVNCSMLWGPNSTTNFWNMSGNNDWCCDAWCYVHPDCPLADGYSMTANPFAYDVCATPAASLYVAAKDSCADPLNISRRLDGGAPATMAATSKDAPEPMRVRPGAGMPSPELKDLDICGEFFLLDGRSPAELPGAWRDARAQVQARCEAEGFGRSECQLAVRHVFEGYPADDTPMHAGTGFCARLLIAAAAATTRSQDMREVEGRAAHWEAEAQRALMLAKDVQAALSRRARPVSSRLRSGSVDRTLQQKLSALAQRQGRPGVAASVRRMKGRTSSSSSSYSDSNSGSSTQLAPRRRAPSRPSAPLSPRRRAPATGTTSDTFRRRRTSLDTAAEVSHRRRTTDISGGTHTTHSGLNYGYTSKSRLVNNFGGLAPFSPLYGYSGAATVTAGSDKNIALLAAPGVETGFARGVGTYYVYNTMYNGWENSSWRRRRATTTEWCFVPQGPQVGQFTECGDCFATYGFCESAAKCYSQDGCGYKLDKAFNRDDMISSGFVPSVFEPPLKVRIYSVTGDGFSKADICPPTKASEVTGDFSSLMTFSVNMFLTLTQVDELGGVDTLTEPTPTCQTNTNYECKVFQDGLEGESACYGDDEVCRYVNDEYMCYCKDGYCLEGVSEATAACQQMANTAGRGIGAGGILPYVAAVFAAAFSTSMAVCPTAPAL